MRLALLAILMFAATACSPTLYETRCGLRFRGSVTGEPLGPEWSQSVVQGREHRLLEAFPAVDDERFHDACPLLKGVSVWVEPDRLFSAPDGKQVYGLTYCDTANVYLGSEGNAFSHEMAHVVQGCNPSDHSNWAAMGIYAAVQEAQFGVSE